MIQADFPNNYDNHNDLIKGGDMHNLNPTNNVEM